MLLGEAWLATRETKLYFTGIKKTNFKHWKQNVELQTSHINFYIRNLQGSLAFSDNDLNTELFPSKIDP